MWILEFLAPRSCVFCGAPAVGEEKSICCGCLEDLPWNLAPISPTPGLLEYSIAPLRYEFPVDAGIKALKFKRKLFYAPALGELLCTVCSLLPADIDGILPVPLHWRRKATRGFNQADELAKPVARLLNVPMIRGVRRDKATPFQSGLDARARARNLRGAFSVRKSLRCRHVLIVDDVITTGTTAQQLARAVLNSGVKKVSVLAIARAD